MGGAIREKFAAANARIAFLLAESRRALRGECDFGPEQVRAISQPISEMAPLMARATELKAEDPEVEREMAAYKEQLSELHGALEQVRMMLTARRGQVQQARNHLDAVSRWADATKLIR